VGWNGSNSGSSAVVKDGGRKPSAKAAPSFKKGIIAGLIVVVGAGIAAFIIGRGRSPSAPQANKAPKSTQIAEVTPQIVTQKVEEVVKPEPSKETPQQKAKRERSAKLKAMTPEQRLNYLYEEAKRMPIDLSASTNQAFRTGTEQAMSWIFTTRLGDPPPPLPVFSMRDDAHMAEIILASNPALETDSEKVKDAKFMVEQAKKELIEYIKQGGNVDEFMDYYRGQLILANQRWKDSQKEVMRVLREEPDIAADYVREVNKGLAEKGIKPVMVPTKYKESLGIED